MAELARQLGVPEADLLTEPCSTNTFANAWESLSFSAGAGCWTLKTILLVSSERICAGCC